MDFKIFSSKKGFDLDSLKPKSFDVLRYWGFALLSSFLILVLGAIITTRIFFTVYMKDYKLEVEDVVVEKINTDELRRVVSAREKFINQEVVVPKDPSI